MIKRITITLILIVLWAGTMAAVSPANSNEPNKPATKTKHITTKKTPIEQKLRSMQRDIKKLEKKVSRLFSDNTLQDSSIDRLYDEVFKNKGTKPKPAKTQGRDAFDTDQVQTKSRRRRVR